MILSTEAKAGAASNPADASESDSSIEVKGNIPVTDCVHCLNVLIMLAIVGSQGLYDTEVHC